MNIAKKTSAARVAAMRKRDEEKGLKRHDIKAFPQDWPEIKELVKLLTEKRLNDKKED